MTVIRGCDTAYPPNPKQVEEAKNEGVKWWGGYFGGADAFNTWTKEDFARVGADGFKILPIWVPVQLPPLDAKVVTESMLKAAEDCGIPKGCYLCLDAETELSAWLSKSVGLQNQLASAISDGGYKLIVYGSGELAIPEWRASWTGRTWPTNVGVQSRYLGAWQWSGSAGTVFVPGADLDVMLSTIEGDLWDGQPEQLSTTAVATQTATTTVTAHDVTGTVAATDTATTPTSVGTVAKVADAAPVADSTVTVEATPVQTGTVPSTTVPTSTLVSIKAVLVAVEQSLTAARIKLETAWDELSKY